MRILVGLVMVFRKFFKIICQRFPLGSRVIERKWEPCGTEGVSCIGRTQPHWRLLDTPSKLATT